MNNEIAASSIDPTITYTTLQLDGHQYQLIFNFRALAMAQQTTGVNFLRGIDFEQMDADKWAALLHAGLGKCHPDVTQEQVYDMVDMRNFPAVLQALLKAFGANEAEQNQENPTMPAAA